MRALIVVAMMFLSCVATAAGSGEADADAGDAVKAAASCIVIHDKGDADGEKDTTCFENLSLERTSFESGVCQWKTDAQAAAQIKITTRFVPYCPTSYSASCDRLVLGPGLVAVRALIVVAMMFLSCVATAAGSGEADADAGDAVKAAASCIVIHDKGDADGEKDTTCFENLSLERTSFESGVCQWKTDAQAAAQIKITTRFVPYCPTSYSASCDRLVLGPGLVAPVKIFLYDQSDDVLKRARKQCLSGGGKWSVDVEET